MKQLKLLFLPLLPALLMACQSDTTNGDDIKAFIPGVYVAPIRSEYSKGEDTLLIGVFDARVNTYVIFKHSGYQRIKEGVIQPKQYAREKCMAVYDESSHVLQALKSGRLFIFSPQKHCLLLGTVEYKKIK